MKVYINKIASGTCVKSFCSFNRLSEDAGKILWGLKDDEEIAALEIDSNGITAIIEHRTKKLKADWRRFK